MDPERNPELLTFSMRQAHKALVRNAERRGARISANHMRRDPWTQARFWRQSRSRERVEQELRRMRTLGLEWLAGVLEEVGPQSPGPWLTNAVPGLGWHQWGQAVDYHVVGPDGRPVWDAGNRGYLVLAEEAARLGLTSGYFWKQQDAGHVQLHRARVREAYGWARIDQEMRIRYAA